METAVREGERVEASPGGREADAERKREADAERQYIKWAAEAERKRQRLEQEAEVERQHLARKAQEADRLHLAWQMERERRDSTATAELTLYDCLRHSAVVIALNNAVTFFKAVSRARAEAKHEQLFMEAKDRLQVRAKWVGSLKDQIASFTDFNERMANMRKGPENQQYFFDKKTEDRAIGWCDLHALDPEEQTEFFAAFRQSQERIKRSFERFNNTSGA
jgi:hypothetical protein